MNFKLKMKKEMMRRRKPGRWKAIRYKRSERKEEK